jgi:hypothetical protein
MAIERVGGAKAYVIKGSTNPQARAQYWSNLVTQEKYRLWEAAQQEALSQMKREELQYQTEADIYATQLKELTDYKTRMKTEVNRLEQQLIKGAPKTSTSSGTRRTGGGGGAQSRLNTQDRALQDIRKVEGELLDIQKNLDKYGTDAPEMSAPYEKSKKNKKAYLEAKSQAVDKSNMTERQKVTVKNYIRKVSEDYELGANVGAIEELPPETEEDKVQETQGTTEPYTTTRTTAGLSEEQKKALTDRIAELKGEIETTQASVKELVAPTIPETSLLQKTREVLGTELQPQARVPRSRPLTPRRRAELEALGMDQGFLNELLTSPIRLPDTEDEMVMETERPTDVARPPLVPVEQAAPTTRDMELQMLGIEPEEFYTTEPATRPEIREARKKLKPKEDALSDLKMEDFRDKPVRAPSSREEAQMRPEIEYKREVIVAANDWDSLVPLLEAEEKQDWVRLVESLYVPTPQQTPAERAELLKNAWDEITLKLSDNRELMKKAHTLLIAIDKDYNSKQTPK